MTRAATYAASRPAVVEMRSRNLWGLVITVAQKHDLQPYSMFDTSKLTFAARAETWALLRENGASQTEIAAWWKVPTKIVGQALITYHKKLGRAAPTASNAPGLINGPGNRRDDCAHYVTCLTIASRRTSSSCHCPSDCSAYKPIQLRATNYTRSTADQRAYYNG